MQVPFSYYMYALKTECCVNIANTFYLPASSSNDLDLSLTYISLISEYSGASLQTFTDTLSASVSTWWNQNGGTNNMSPGPTSATNGVVLRGGGREGGRDRRLAVKDRRREWGMKE